MLDEAAVDSRSTSLVPGADAPAQARRWIRWFEGYLTPETAHDVEIAVSELVTNAVKHAGLSETDSIELAAHVRRDTLRVTIRDKGRGINPDRPVSPPDASSWGGWGLPIVRRLSRRVLIDGSEGMVMFEVPLLVVR